MSAEVAIILMKYLINNCTVNWYVFRFSSTKYQNILLSMIASLFLGYTCGKELVLLKLHMSVLDSYFCVIYLLF